MKRNVAVCVAGLACTVNGPLLAQEVTGDSLGLPSASNEAITNPATMGSALATVPVATQKTEESSRPSEAKASASSRSSSRLVEEIIVTAQKREENLKDVPVSIQAFSADYLDAKAVVNQRDLPKLTPGLTISEPVGFTTTYIRGVGTDAFILADPVVVTYIDDVYFPNSSGLTQEFGDIERIEVLKGPQGTLFGRNALGGAIRIQTKQPSLKEVQVSTAASYSTTKDNDGYKVRASVSVPLVEDTLAFSVSGLYGSEEFYLRDSTAYTPEAIPLPNFVSRAVRAKLLWVPSDSLDVQLNVNYFDENSTNRQFALNTDPSILIGGPLVAQDRRSGRINESVYAGGSGPTYYGKIQYHAPWFDMRLLGSDQNLSFTKSFDFDATPLPVAFFDSSNIFTKATSAELQIVSNSESPFSAWLEWIVGAYYFKSQQGLDPAGFHAAQIDLTQGVIAGIRVPQALTNVLSPILSSLPLPSGVDINLTGIQDTDSIAYFAQTTFHLTDWVSLTLGGRYQVEDRALKESSSGVRLADGTVVPIQYYSAYDDSAMLYSPDDFKDTTKQFDPKVSINLRPGGSVLGDEPLIYANWQTATTSLVYNVVNLYDRPEKVKSSDIEAYEVGFKTYLFDRLINLNVAVFDYTLKNSQAQVVSLQSGGAVRFENVPESKIRGADFDALILLFPELTDYGLVLTLGGAYLDAEYTDYPQGGGFDEVTGLYTQSYNFTGNRVVQTPKLTGSLGLTQTFRFPGGPLDVGVDYYYNDGFFMYAQNTPNSEIGSYGVLGFNVSYLYESWKLRASVFGTNVTNEDYDVAVFLNDFGADRFPSRLAQYGVRLSWEF